MSDDSSEMNDERLTVDAICALLAHHRRRELVRYLRAADEPVTVTAAAAALAATTADVPEAGDSDAVERTAIALYHVHIPKLAAHDVVEYDRERDRLVLTECASQLRPYLELDAAGEQ